MKRPAITPGATARVLSEIDRALAPTAIAVERVLRTASAGLGDQHDTTRALCAAVGVRPRIIEDCWEEDCAEVYTWDDATPGMVYVGQEPLPDLEEQQARYAPWLVSPHLFASDALRRRGNGARS